MGGMVQLKSKVYKHSIGALAWSFNMKRVMRNVSITSLRYHSRDTIINIHKLLNSDLNVLL